MSALEDFVNLELPRRPFVYTDGPEGHVLVRSQNTLAIRELVWTDPWDLGPQEPEAATYTYNAIGDIIAIEEVIGGEIRNIALTYNDLGDILIMIVDFRGVTKTTTFSYDINGNLSGYMVT
jgi:hypothetical protein